MEIQVFWQDNINTLCTLNPCASLTDAKLYLVCPDDDKQGSSAKYQRLMIRG